MNDQNRIQNGDPDETLRIPGDFQTIPREKPADDLAARIRTRYERYFPFGERIADSYAIDLLRQCVVQGGRLDSGKFTSTIEDLILLERISLSRSDSSQFEFYRSAKRSVSSYVFEIALKFLLESNASERDFAGWNGWLLARSVSNVGDFDFWNGWRNRFEMEGLSRKIESAQGVSLEIG